MCSIVVGWRWDQHCGDGVGRRSEGTGWDGTKLCRQKVSMGKMSAGTGGDGYEITYPCKTSCQCESCTGTNYPHSSVKKYRRHCWERMSIHI